MTSLVPSVLSKNISGSCYCGRNKYTIVPQPAEACPIMGPPPHFFYCNCGDCRRIYAAPIVPYIRIPKEWASFTTHTLRQGIGRKLTNDFRRSDNGHATCGIRHVVYIFL
ncbi:hypothetical protein BDZ91DRAFT_351204 [Kalaharituber pfeilii]|nr:hypothetical protein BDZ91DRAFT_351204 [Kalaharituber pfeilii]